MRELFATPHLLTSRNQIVIRDNHDKIHYLMANKFSPNGRILTVYDPNGTTLATLTQTSLGNRPNFILSVQDEPSIHFKNHKNSPIHMFYIPELHWIVTGNANKQTYRVLHFYHTIMDLKKSYSNYGEALYLKIDQKNHEVACLCIAAVIDSWNLASFHDRLMQRSNGGLNLAGTYNFKTER